MKLLSVLAFLVLLLSCGIRDRDNTRYAENEYYYLKIVDDANTERSERFISDLFSNIPENKYTITFSSGSNGWPFYQTFSLDARLPVDSIIPPHTIFHVIRPFEPDQSHDEGNYLIEAILRPPLEDGSPVMKFTMFRYKEGFWEKVVDLKDHEFSVKKYPSYQEQYQILEETIIRSSFK